MSHWVIHSNHFHHSLGTLFYYNYYYLVDWLGKLLLFGDSISNRESDTPNLTVDVVQETL